VKRMKLYRFVLPDKLHRFDMVIEAVVIADSIDEAKELMTAQKGFEFYAWVYYDILIEDFIVSEVDMGKPQIVLFNNNQG